MRNLLVLALISLGTLPVVAQPTTQAQVLQAAVENVIRPSMVDFEARSIGLTSAMTALCDSPSADIQTITKDLFRQTAVAYGRTEYLRIGPVMDDNRVDRLMFFPDRKGIGLKQVQAILSTEDPAAATLESLRGKSIAVQGFGALEFVLFGTGSETLASAEGSYRCSYGLAIAQNIAQIANELSSGWFAPDGVADHLRSPKPENYDYRTEQEAIEALVGLIAHGNEAIRDQRLLPFLPRDGKAAQPKQALFWRSNLTVGMLRANFEGLKTMAAESGVAGLGASGQGGIDRSIAIQFDRAIAALDTVVAPVDVALADPVQEKAFEDAVGVTEMMDILVGTQMAKALNLSVGFSALDGD